jgi:zinc protease
MNEPIGGMFSARVNMNLREAKGWSYGAYTFFQNARGPRPWLVYAPVQTDKTTESLAELRRELTEFTSSRPLTSEEFERARTNSIRTLPGSFETASNVLGALTSAATSGRPLDWTPTLAQRYRAMTLAEAQSASREIVDPNKLVWVVVGDRARIEAGLRGLNIAPLEIWDENGNEVR